MGIRDTHPARSIDPLLRAKRYVDRRSGAIDPAQERRRQRTIASAPQSGAGPALQRVDSLPSSASGMEPGRFYRVPGSGATPDQIITPFYDGAATAIGVVAVDQPQSVSGSATWNPGSIASKADDGVVIAVAGVAIDGTWVCAGSFTSLMEAGNTQWFQSIFPSGAGTVVYRIQNNTNNAHDLGSGTVAIRCWKIG